MLKMNFSSVINKLDKNLKLKLPGLTAHQPFEAFSANYLKLKPTEVTRKSAVLMLLYPDKDSIRFPLILRNSYNGFHSREIGFPGGKQEFSDKDLIHTALREANEEIGISISDVKILGTLTEIYIGPSDFTVLPVIAYLPYKPIFRPDPHEVQHIFETNLDYFLNPEIVGRSEIEIPNDLVYTPYYQLENHKVWGATAKIINELLTILKNNSPQ